MTFSMKTLFAAITLATAYSANAATIATFDVTNNATVNFMGSQIGTVAETGTAVLDDSGILTIDKTGTTSTNPGSTFVVSSEIVYQGTITGNTYTVSSGTLTYTQCVSGSCAVALNSPQTLTPTPASGDGGGLPAESLDIGAGGTFNLVFAQYNGMVVADHTMALTPTVPVPAAAWLFGSGLLGIAGAKRRHSAKVG
jgi:hypothetical protein